MNYLSKQSAIETVRQLFSKTEEDYVSLEDAFTAWGRDLSKVEENRAWFSNKLTHLKYHNLVQSKYAKRNKKKVLVGIQLTINGKRSLGKATDDHPTILEVNKRTSVTLDDIVAAIPSLKEKYKEFEITFSIKPKEQ